MTSSLCPYCNASVSFGSSPCGLCGASLAWNALPDGFKLKTDAGQKLELVRVLGRGGFGVTYLATRYRTAVGERRVALKECFPDGLVTRDSSGQVIAKPGCESEFADILRKFLIEAQLLNQIKHPVSSEFLACWQANNTAYLMMEFIEGETLEAQIAGGYRLAEFEAVAVLESILDLLEGIHAQNLLHRDIKPANIIRTKAGVELIDFGSAIKFDPQRSTKISSKILTPAYAPLELYGSQVRLGPSSDLYSLAATVYEAMIGVRVPSALDRSNGAIVQPLEAVSNSVSRAFSKLIARALELRIDDRFGTAQEMRAALPARWRVKPKPASSAATSRTAPSMTVSTAHFANVPVTPATSSTSSRAGFRLPRWALITVGIVGLIFAANRFLAFREWQAELEQTRLAREAFIADQCEMLEKDISNSFTCSVRVESSDNRQVVLRASLVDLLIRRDGGRVRNLGTDPEFVDFVYELAGNALDLYGVDVVQFEGFTDPLAKKFLAQFSIDRIDIAKHSKRPVSVRLAELRVARAKKRLMMPSNETFLALVGRREIENSEFGQKWRLKISSLTWNTDKFPLQTSEGNGATLFVEVPGNADILGMDVLRLAKDPAFRLGLRDMIVRLHRALSDAPYIAVFVGKTEASSVWSVSAASYSDNEFAQLAKASNVQLDDIWSFSSEYFPPIADGYPAEYNAVNAYVIPVQVRQADAPISLGNGQAGGQYVLGILQATEVYTIGREKRKFQAAKQLEAELINPQSEVMRADVIDYGNAKLLLACCANPREQFSIKYTASNGLFSAAEPFSDFVLAQSQFKPGTRNQKPVNVLRLRLNQDRSGVILECDPQVGMVGLVVQVKSEKGVFSDWLEAPENDFLSNCNMTVPFKEFGSRNSVRVLRLSFRSESLLGQNMWNKGEWVQASTLSASALEAPVLARDQLIALRRGESLEFGRGVDWVKK